MTGSQPIGPVTASEAAGARHSLITHGEEKCPDWTKDLYTPPLPFGKWAVLVGLMAGSVLLLAIWAR